MGSPRRRYRPPSKPFALRTIVEGMDVDRLRILLMVAALEGRENLTESPATIARTMIDRCLVPYPWEREDD